MKVVVVLYWTSRILADREIGGFKLPAGQDGRLDRELPNLTRTPVKRHGSAGNRATKFQAKKFKNLWPGWVAGLDWEVQAKTRHCERLFTFAVNDRLSIDIHLEIHT
jgi:hypothetical protein